MDLIVYIRESNTSVELYEMKFFRRSSKLTLETAKKAIHRLYPNTPPSRASIILIKNLAKLHITKRFKAHMLSFLDRARRKSLILFVLTFMQRQLDTSTSFFYPGLVGVAIPSLYKDLRIPSNQVLETHGFRPVGWFISSMSFAYDISVCRNCVNAWEHLSRDFRERYAAFVYAFDDRGQEEKVAVF
ncbi:hypothetical protein EJ08DRAFT_334748 [Tothia fuscella]|uniref:Uncharacterized protein n=1 Tax=Tothia fuscella TaxID=1048955 RepID=A0A9P4P2C5_9PEZI|nr:hypothetical protein EJ08DRAFT_334748 [Tothia fuscella]